jgi:drug/metabolite transporter (DMT)-like permease
MLWYVLSIIGAIADAGYYIAVKNFLQTADPLILAAGGYSCTGAILLLVSGLGGVPPIGHAFFSALIASSVLGIIAVLLTYSALRQTDISLAVPMISFTPLFLIVTAFVLLREAPSLMGIAGIIIIVTGSYVLNLSSSHRKWTDPFRSIVKNRGVLSMLVVSLIYAVAINFDKIIVTNSDPVFGSAVACFVLGLSFAGMSRSARLRDLVNPIIASPHLGSPRDGPAIPAKALTSRIGQWVVLGILLSFSAVSINIAYTLQIVPYVIAIKRMSIIIMVLYGGFVFLEEDVMRRLSGALLMVAGAVIIVLFN